MEEQNVRTIKPWEMKAGVVYTFASVNPDAIFKKRFIWFMVDSMSKDWVRVTYIDNPNSYGRMNFNQEWDLQEVPLSSLFKELL